MDKKTIGNWIMYYEVQRLQREGLSISSIAQTLGLNRRTVRKYGSMTEQEYEAFLIKNSQRNKVLGEYEDFVRSRLMAHPAASAAQVFDWLKEHYPGLPSVTSRTVYNFVIEVRQKYNIPVESAPREYFVVEELPYGQQAQADFGQYYLRNSEEKKKKIHFFVMMLSRSRMKYVHFSSIPFTTNTAIDAHEAAFEFFKGITAEVVYDQDRLLLISEHLGELLLTQEFKSYVSEHGFRTYFCRKSDPESKGKVENVVKYVKHNFLYGRAYYDIETLQAQAMAWLVRTGNGIAHSTTRKVPEQEWQIEREHLKNWTSVRLIPSYILRYLRIDNTFSFEGNFYSVPQGSYKKDSKVKIYLRDGELHVYDEQEVFLCKHTIAATKGNKILNRDHKRDKSKQIKELIAEVAGMFINPTLAHQYFEMIKEHKGRYLRDQVQAIREAISERDKELVNTVLGKCVQERYLSAAVFNELLSMHEQEVKGNTAQTGKIILLDPNSTRKAAIQPDKRNLGDYEKVFNS